MSGVQGRTLDFGGDEEVGEQGADETGLDRRYMVKLVLFSALVAYSGALDDGMVGKRTRVDSVPPVG